jgi:hypothetical protein
MLAQTIFVRSQEDKEAQCCIATCIPVNGSKCVGTIWPPKREEDSLFELVKCQCPCHDNDSEPLNYEQKRWLKRRMSSPMAEPYKPLPPIELSLVWTEET